MGVKGIGSYPQGAKFSYPRAFISLLGYGNILTFSSQAGRFFTFTFVPDPTVFVVYGITSEVFAWSSNGYSLDFFVTDCYAYTLVFPTPFPLDYRVTYFPPTTTHLAGIDVHLGVDASTRLLLPLPPQDQPYWLPAV